MGLNLTIPDDTGTEFTLPPAGTLFARLVDVIDLGSQLVEFNGDQKYQHKVLLGFEILGDERRNDGTPHVVRRTVTLSLHEKAALRQILTAMTGGNLPRSLDEVAGTYCTVSVAHATNAASGRTYANLVSVQAMPKGIKPTDGELPIRVFNVDEPDWSVFNGLPEWLREKVGSSPEFKRTKQPGGAKPAAVNVDELI